MGGKYEIRTRDGQSHYLNTFREFVFFFEEALGKYVLF